MTMSWGEMPGQLERFAAVLRREGATRTTADFIDTQIGRFTSEWKAKRTITAQRMPLPLPRNQGLHPVGCELQDCFVSFTYEASDDDGPPRRADFQVQVAGLLLAGDGLVELEDHWRIDTDVYAAPAEAGGDPEGQGSREPHPIFHFQRGGHAQDAFAAQDGFVPGAQTNLGAGTWRGLLQYSGPRIASLPFDPILAIDFCIAQNDGPLWKRLRNVPEYHAIIEELQDRLWRPFLEALAVRQARRRWLGPLVVV